MCFTLIMIGAMMPWRCDALETITSVSGDGIVEGQFVLSLRPDARIQGPELLQQWAQDNGYGLQRVFPLHQPPTKLVNEMGLPLTDLSLFYRVTLPQSASRSKPDLAKILQSAKAISCVQWAEPFYEHDLLYTPNDPLANPAVTGQGNYLNLIKAYDAWNVTKGDSSIKIGVVDSGLDVLQEDLRNKIAFNTSDPINGVDDDNNGFVDDYYGWNFFNNNNNLGIAINSNGHGQVVAGIAAAEANNGRGIAGIGFKTMFVPVVVFGPNNQSAADLYAGVVYAADRGCQVINLSWGRNRNNQSEFERAIINYAAINKNATIVAAAGNTPAELDFLPASYPYVLSVAFNDYADQLDVAATFSAYIDINAPGGNIWSINAVGGYNSTSSGSSFAAPMVAAGAALAKAVYPNYNALQIAELVRVNTDDNRFVGVNRNRYDRVGSGRLNLINAVTKTKPIAMRISDVEIVGRQSGSARNSGDTLEIRLKVTNYLDPVLFGNVQVSVSAGNAVVTQGFWQFGALPTLGSATNTSIPLRIFIPANTPLNQSTILVFRLGSNNYTDFQSHKFTVNQDFVTVANNRFGATYSSPGRIAYQDVTNQIGNSITLDGKLLVGGSGLLIGANPQQVPNNVIDTTGKDLHFGSLSRIRSLPTVGGILRATSAFKDSLYGRNRLGLLVRQSISSLPTIPANRCHILEYEILNQSQTAYDSLSIGVLTDWDLNNYSQNFARWDTTNRLGYAYNAAGGASYYGPQIYAGVQAVGGGEPQYFASDLDQAVQGTNVNFNGGFSLANKFRSMSRGILRPEAGFSKPMGNDVATITGIKLRRLLPGQKAKVAFAIGAGYSLAELRSTVNSAKAAYSAGRTGPIPSISSMTVCAGADVLLAPSNGQQFNFYDRPALSTPIGTGRFLLVRNVRRTTTFYVTNIDSVFESQATPLTVTTTGPQADFVMTPSVLDLQIGNTVNFSNQSTGATSYAWDFGNGNTSTLPSTTQRYNIPGIYQIKLIVRSATSPCADTLQLPLVVTDGTTSLATEAQRAAYQPYPIPTADLLMLRASNPWQLYDATSRLVASGHGSQIPTNAYANGLYWLELSTEIGVLRYRVVVAK